MVSTDKHCGWQPHPPPSACRMHFRDRAWECPGNAPDAHASLAAAAMHSGQKRGWRAFTLAPQPEQRMRDAATAASASGPEASATADATGTGCMAGSFSPYLAIQPLSIQSLTLHSQAPCTLCRLAESLIRWKFAASHFQTSFFRKQWLTCCEGKKPSDSCVSMQPCRRTAGSWSIG